MQELLHRQDILEKSHKQELIKEIKKRKALIAQSKQAEEKVNELTAALNVINSKTKLNIETLFIGKG